MSLQKWLNPRRRVYWSSLVKIFKQQLLYKASEQKTLHSRVQKYTYSFPMRTFQDCYNSETFFMGTGLWTSRAEQEIVQENAINSPILCCGTFRLPVTRSRISSIYTGVYVHICVCVSSSLEEKRESRGIRSPGIGTKSLQFAYPRIDFDQMHTVRWVA